MAEELTPEQRHQQTQEAILRLKSAITDTQTNVARVSVEAKQATRTLELHRRALDDHGQRIEAMERRQDDQDRHMKVQDEVLMTIKAIVDRIEAYINTLIEIAQRVRFRGEAWESLRKFLLAATVVAGGVTSIGVLLGIAYKAAQVFAGQSAP